MRSRIFITAFAMTAILAAAPGGARADSGPSIGALSPATLPSGGGGFTLTIDGAGFDSSAKVAFDEDVLTPISTTPSRIQVAVPAADIAGGGYVGVTVTTAAGSSPLKLFTVENSAPQIAGLSPNTAYTGGNGFTLTVIGAGFNAQTQLLFGPDLLTPDSATPTQLTITVPAGEIAAAGAITLSAVNPDPVTGVSNSQRFIVVNPYPIISTVSPNAVLAGSADTTVKITGLNFTNTSVVQWSGAALATTFVSATSLGAVIPAADLAAAGPANITVSDSSYGVSAPVPFQVTARTPTVKELSPASAGHGDPGFTLTVNGANFQASSVIHWGGAALTTTFISAGRLSAAVPAALLGSPAFVPVVVTTPMAGKTAATAALTFTISPSAPVLTSMDTTTKVAGSRSFLLVVHAAKVLKGITIQWNGAPLATGIFSPTVLTAQVSADMVATAGTAVVTLTNPGAKAPSNALSFQITTPTKSGKK